MEGAEEAVVTRAALRKREREDAPIAARTRKPAGAARARQTPRAASPRAVRRALPRPKKRARDAATPSVKKSSKPERSSPRGKKGAAAASASPKPAKASPSKADAAASAAAAASGATGGADSPADAPPESSNAALNALLRKLGGGSFEDIFGRSTDSNKFASILKGLQSTGNDSAQLQALSELCEVLSMGTEESLRHFSSESFVPVLMNLLNSDWNPDIMLYACRALTHMMEALPNSQRAVVQFGCVEVLCAKLMSIEYIDLAEQALLALGKLAEGHGRTLFRSGGLMAVLSYLDFFPTGVQRAAMSTAAAMCRQAPPDCFSMVKDAIPNLTGLLGHHDQRTLESTCTCFIRLSECYSSNPEQIAALADHGLIKHLLRLVTGCDGSLLEGGFAIAPPVSQSIFAGLIKLLAAVAGSSAKLRQDLLDEGAANAIAAMLSPDGRATNATLEVKASTSSPASTTGPTGSPILVCNSSTQLIEVLGVVNSMLPTVADATPFEAELEPKPAGVAGSPKAKSSKPTPAEVQGATKLAKSVFALLIAVCTTTQTTAVAHKSLRALNKIVAVMPKEKLTELPFGNVARFIADLMVSNDLVVLSGALNMSELLMTKLEDEFRESFVREGVVHEIQNLGKQTRKDALARTGSVDTDTQRLYRTASLRLERAAVEQAAARRRQSAGGSPASSSLPDIDKTIAELHRMRHDPKSIFVEKVQQHAERFRSTFFADDGSVATTKLLGELREISKKLNSIADKPCKGAALTAGNRAFGRVAQLMSDESKVSVFELSESGLVGAIVNYIRGSKGIAETRKKLELLCKHFDATGVNQPAEGSDNTSSPTPALSILISKLHACIKSQESLPIHLNEIAGGVTEGLRLLSRPFKLRLVPKEGDSSLADLSPNVVLIEPLATIHSVHEFLLAKLTEAHEARAEASDLLESGGSGGASGGRSGLGSLSGALRRGSASSDTARRSRDRAGSSRAKKRSSSATAGSADADDGTPVAWECDIDGLGTWVEYMPDVNTKLAAAFRSKSKVTFKRSTHTYTIDFSSATPAQVNTATGVRRSIRQKAETDELSAERSSRRRRYRPWQEDPFSGLDDEEDILERALAEQAELRRALKASARAEAGAASAAGSSDAAGPSASSSDDDEAPMPDDDDDDSSPEAGGSIPDGDDDDVFGGDRMDTDDADESVDDIALGASPALGSTKPKSGRSPSGPRATKRKSGGKSASASASGSSSAASGSEPASSASAADADGAPPPLKLAGDASIPTKLSFSIHGAVLDHDTTIFHAVQAHARTQRSTSASGGAAASAADENEDDQHTFAPATRAMWSEIYELHYCRHESVSVASSSSNSMSSSSTQADGEGGLCDRTLASALGDDIGQEERALDSIRDLLVMLRVSSWLMTPSHRLQLGLSAAVADGAAGTGLEQSEVLNSTLTGKVLRQLQDPLSLCSGVPNWMDSLIRACPYIFSFECKHQYFACTQLGLSRGLGRLQAAEQAAGIPPTAAGRHGGSAEPRSVSLRIQRQKVRISRSRILDSATKVLELYGTTKALLEVEFFGEVGTGLGPTLEFYTISSRELQRTSLGMWRSSGVSSKGASDGSDEYVTPSEFGLFPAPQPLGAREATHVSGDGGSLRSGREGKHALPDRFRLLGRLIAKALQDNRLLDIHLSPLLYRLLACPVTSVGSLLTRTELSQVDPALAKTVSKLSSMLQQKQAADSNSSLSTAAKSAAIAAITYDGAPLESLYLDFTCPGYPDVALCEGGADKPVTLDNLEEYIEAVVDATLGSGIRAQVLALRAGFEDIVPLSAVDFFEPAEMDRLICGENAPWSMEELRDSCKADHGYTLDSPAVQTLSEMTAAEQRAFLCFATGSPRLPIGGLSALTPPLTIVRRGSDGDGDDPDFFLPTVMTCANYIKLPKYTSAAVLKTQLLKAITEGQGSFHLS